MAYDAAIKKLDKYQSIADLSGSFLLLDQNPTPQTVTASPVLDWLTASQALMTDANKKLISVDYLNQAVKTTSTPSFRTTTINSPNGSAGTGLKIVQEANNASAALSYVAVDFYQATSLLGQIFLSASNYNSGGGVNLAANSFGFFAEHLNGQLALGAGGANGYFTVNTGGYSSAYERLNISKTGTVKLNAYTTDGFVKFSASNGTLTVDTNTYYKSGDTVTFANITDSGLTLNYIPFASTAGLLSNNIDFQFPYNAVSGNGLGINHHTVTGATNKLTVRGDAKFTATGLVSYVNTSKVCTSDGGGQFTTELAIGDYVSLTDGAQWDRVAHITSDTQFETYANNLGYGAGSGKTLKVWKALVNFTTSGFVPASGTFPSNALLIDADGAINIRQSITLPNGYGFYVAGNAYFASSASGNVLFRIDSTDYGIISTSSAQFGGTTANYALLLGNDGAGGATRETHYLRGGNNGGSSNGNGCPLIISSGMGRGTASTQYLSLQTPVQTTSGTTLQTLVDRMTFKTGLTAGGEGIIINDTGADYDLRIEGDTDANLFYLDASTDRIGIGTATPSYKLDISGDINFTGGMNVNGTAGLDVTLNFYSDGTSGQVTQMTFSKGILTSYVSNP